MHDSYPSSATFLFDDRAEGELPSPGRSKEEILRARAKALARVPDGAGEAGQERLQIVEFMLGDEHYAITTDHVREVYALRELTALPCTPAFVCGIINVRGQILTVLDMAELFGLSHQSDATFSNEGNEGNRVLIVRGPDGEMGLLADAVVGVRTIAPSEMQPVAPGLGGKRAEWMRGVTSERLIVLDAARMMADPMLQVNEEVTT